MTELLTQLLLPLTLSLAMLLLLHKPMLEKFGAGSVYYAWILVPISLFSYLLPVSWINSNNGAGSQVEHFIVGSNQVIQQSFSINWVVFIWFAVSAGLFSYWLVTHISFVRSLNIQSVEITDKKLQMPAALSVYQSTHVFSPMLVGLFKQKLIIPEDFDAVYNKEQQRLILQHEICHFDRNDIVWNLVAFLTLTLFWFHPLVWLGYFRFRRDQELSCDQMVLARKHLSSRINYSKALLVTAQTTPPIAFAQLSFNQYRKKNVMFERIKNIKNTATMGKAGLSVLSLVSLITLSSITYAGNVGHEGAKVKDADFEAKPIMRVEPKYPTLAMEQGISGAVLLKYDISEDGNTYNIHVIKSQPGDMFDSAAVDALAQWKYESHSHGVIADNLVQLDFLLDDSAKKTHLIEGIRVNK